MRFLTRSLIGMALLALTLALLAAAAGNIVGAVKERAAREEQPRRADERVFTVQAAPFEVGTADPVMTAYGEISSWRSLELRSAASGRLTELSPVFRDGAFVEEGALLFAIDPADAQTAVDLALASIQETEAELADAQAAKGLAELELEASSEQRQLQAHALTRQQDLLARGVGSNAAVDNATLALASARQTELARRQSLAQADSRIARAQITLERNRIGLGEAERRLAETRMVAPFDGILSQVGAVKGRMVGTNEQLAILVDPTALEVAFQVSNAQFSRLIDARGALLPVDVTATLDLPGAPIPVKGQLDRAGAEVGEGQTGRQLFASIGDAAANILRPGDFMRVEIAEPQLRDVAVIPASAVSSDGRMLLIGDGDRLEAASVTILRRQADSVIIGAVPAEREYVVRLQPQLGAGVKVKVFRPGAGFEEKEMVVLDPARRDALIAAVEANTRMPSQAKDRILGQLRAEKVPAETVERLEARMAGRSGQGGNGGGAGGERGGDVPDGPTISLDPERKARLVAFVEGNSFMPDDAKTRILAQLKNEAVPQSLVTRLEARMGG